jgi:NarL family two-component system response regulator LiaR
MQNKITILIADDHPLMREALRAHFVNNPEFEIVAEAGDGEEAVRLADEKKPDVVVMDISMPKMNGIEATRQIKENIPAAAILILSVHSDCERILGVLAAGAAGYLTKNAIGQEIAEAVRLIHSGETVLSSAVSRELIKYALRNNTQSPTPLIKSIAVLNIRELEVLKLAAKGKSNKDIANSLLLSTPTVKGYIADIFSKLNANSRTEAVITGLRMGLLNLSDIE